MLLVIGGGGGLTFSVSERLRKKQGPCGFMLVVQGRKETIEEVQTRRDNLA
jgi:hypothetical protein